MSYLLTSNGDAELKTSISTICPLKWLDKIISTSNEITKDKAEKEKQQLRWERKKEITEWESKSKWHKIWNLPPRELLDKEIRDFHLSRLKLYKTEFKIIAWQKITEKEFNKILKDDIVDNIFLFNESEDCIERPNA